MTKTKYQESALFSLDRKQFKIHQSNIRDSIKACSEIIELLQQPEIELTYFIKYSKKLLKGITSIPYREGRIELDKVKGHKYILPLGLNSLNALVEETLRMGSLWEVSAFLIPIYKSKKAKASLPSRKQSKDTIEQRFLLNKLSHFLAHQASSDPLSSSTSAQEPKVYQFSKEEVTEKLKELKKLDEQDKSIEKFITAKKIKDQTILKKLYEQKFFHAIEKGLRQFNSLLYKETISLVTSDGKQTSESAEILFQEEKRKLEHYVGFMLAGKPLKVIAQQEPISLDIDGNKVQFTANQILQDSDIIKAGIRDAKKKTSYFYVQQPLDPQEFVKKIISYELNVQSASYDKLIKLATEILGIYEKTVFFKESENNKDNNSQSFYKSVREINLKIILLQLSALQQQPKQRLYSEESRKQVQTIVRNIALARIKGLWNSAIFDQIEKEIYLVKPLSEDDNAQIENFLKAKIREVLTICKDTLHYSRIPFEYYRSLASSLQRLKIEPDEEDQIIDEAFNLLVISNTPDIEALRIKVKDKHSRERKGFLEGSYMLANGKSVASCLKEIYINQSENEILKVNFRQDISAEGAHQIVDLYCSKFSTKSEAFDKFLEIKKEILQSQIQALFDDIQKCIGILSTNIAFDVTKLDSTSSMESEIVKINEAYQLKKNIDRIKIDFMYRLRKLENDIQIYKLYSPTSHFDIEKIYSLVENASDFNFAKQDRQKSVEEKVMQEYKTHLKEAYDSALAISHLSKSLAPANQKAKGNTKDNIDENMTECMTGFQKKQAAYFIDGEKAELYVQYSLFQYQMQKYKSDYKFFFHKIIEEVEKEKIAALRELVELEDELYILKHDAEAYHKKFSKLQEEIQTGYKGKEFKGKKSSNRAIGIILFELEKEIGEYKRDDLWRLDFISDSLDNQIAVLQIFCLKLEKAKYLSAELESKLNQEIVSNEGKSISLKILRKTTRENQSKCLELLNELMSHLKGGYSIKAMFSMNALQEKIKSFAKIFENSISSQHNQLLNSITQCEEKFSSFLKATNEENFASLINQLENMKEILTDIRLSATDLGLEEVKNMARKKVDEVLKKFDKKGIILRGKSPITLKAKIGNLTVLLDLLNNVNLSKSNDSIYVEIGEAIDHLAKDDQIKQNSNKSLIRFLSEIKEVQRQIAVLESSKKAIEAAKGFDENLKDLHELEQKLVLKSQTRKETTELEDASWLEGYAEFLDCQSKSNSISDLLELLESRLYEKMDVDIAIGIIKDSQLEYEKDSIHTTLQSFLRGVEIADSNLLIIGAIASLSDWEAEHISQELKEEIIQVLGKDFWTGLRTIRNVGMHALDSSQLTETLLTTPLKEDLNKVRLQVVEGLRLLIEHNIANGNSNSSILLVKLVEFRQDAQKLIPISIKEIKDKLPEEMSIQHDSEVELLRQANIFCSNIKLGGEILIEIQKQLKDDQDIEIEDIIDIFTESVENLTDQELKLRLKYDVLLQALGQTLGNLVRLEKFSFFTKLPLQVKENEIMEFAGLYFPLYREYRSSKTHINHINKFTLKIIFEGVNSMAFDAKGYTKELSTQILIASYIESVAPLTNLSKPVKLLKNKDSGCNLM